MKALVALLITSLCSACAVLPKAPTHKKHTGAHERGNADTRKKKAKVRTEELVKAYPVGRYSDPNDRDTMHERHVLYRREEAANWNYLPDQPETLPLGPVVAESNPSSSYYVKTDAELMNAQQKAQADALAEQNRALQKRIAALQQKDSGSQAEIDRLKKQLVSIPAAKPAPATTAAPPSPSSRPWEDFTDKPQ
jgi:hypothetical protein